MHTNVFYFVYLHIFLSSIHCKKIDFYKYLQLLTNICYYYNYTIDITELKLKLKLELELELELKLKLKLELGWKNDK